MIPYRDLAGLSGNGSPLALREQAKALRQQALAVQAVSPAQAASLRAQADAMDTTAANVERDQASINMAVAANAKLQKAQAMQAVSPQAAANARSQAMAMMATASNLSPARFPSTERVAAPRGGAAPSADRQRSLFLSPQYVTQSGPTAAPTPAPAPGPAPVAQPASPVPVTAAPLPVEQGVVPYQPGSVMHTLQQATSPFQASLLASNPLAVQRSRVPISEPVSYTPWVLGLGAAGLALFAWLVFSGGR